MPTVSEWPSGGMVAGLALVFYGVLLVSLVLSRLSLSRTISRLLPMALLWHLLVCCFTAFWMLPYYVAATGGADNYLYHTDGITIAGLIRNGDWGAISWGWNTAAMPIITGLIYAPFGPDIYGMLFFSAALGLCACVYFCAAFSLWATPQQLKTYSLIILLLPSLVIWTGYFGKDSWIALGLGMTAYGYSKILKSRASAGLWHLVAGIVVTTIVRPHIAVAVSAAMTFAYLWGVAQARRGTILTKVAMVLMLTALLGVLVTVASGFLGLADVSAEGMQEFARQRGSANAIGGSAVEIQAAPGVLGALRAYPRGIVRILFEPFPWNVNSFPTGMAATENLFILILILRHGSRLPRMVRQIASDPYPLFSFTLAGSLLLLLSFTPNLGLLSRERTQLLPFLFVPLVGIKRQGKSSIPPRGVVIGAVGPMSRGRPWQAGSTDRAAQLR